MANKPQTGKPAQATRAAKSGLGSGPAIAAGNEPDPPFRVPVGEVVLRMASVLTLEYAGRDDSGCRYVRNQLGEPCAFVKLPATFEPKNRIQIAIVLDGWEQKC